MENRFRSEQLYDGTWWEAEIPAGWFSLGRDKSLKGFPHAFGAPSGACLLVHVNNCSGTEMDVSFVPSDLTHTQKICYAVAAYDSAIHDQTPVDLSGMSQRARAALSLEISRNFPARLREAATKLERVEQGTMVGFIRRLNGKSEIGWHGYFAIDTHWLNAWIYMNEWNNNDAYKGLAFLASIVIQRPNPSFQRTASGGR